MRIEGDWIVIDSVYEPEVIQDYPALTKINDITGTPPSPPGKFQATVEGPQATLDAIAADPKYTVIG